MRVYRRPARELSGATIQRELLGSMQRLDRDPIGDCALEALLRAGELECALADLNHPCAQSASLITDSMASHVLVHNGRSLQWAEQSLRSLDLPPRIHLRTPAGFAYDGLDPRRYATLAPRLPLRAAAPVAVIGVRSIGTSLSAIVSEALRLRGHAVERITVRPSGLPWARTLTLQPEEAAFVVHMLSRKAEFLVVDEGPHASGSTFLSVAEALERTGVPAKSIALCTSRIPDPNRLLAESASMRWPRYRAYAADTWNPDSSVDLSAGAWRRCVFGEDASAWPACWTQLERIKRRTADGQWLDKFEGFAPYRDAPFERACVLAQAGYAPSPTWLGHGFVRYPWLDGTPARASDLDGHMLRELARYCAFRAREFRTNDVDPSGLERMVETNVDAVFGISLGSRAKLPIEWGVVPDARMQPFEWRLSRPGRLMKTDGHAHGDCVLLPGPIDICWDLAGAIIEWHMDAAHRDQFVHDYSMLSGDEPHARLPCYLLAYCAQRLGETFVAAASAEPRERDRLWVAHEHYRDELERMLGTPPVVRPEPRARRQRRLTQEYARGKKKQDAA
jgi:hypothetical protein